MARIVALELSLTVGRAAQKSRGPGTPDRADGRRFVSPRPPGAAKGVTDRWMARRVACSLAQCGSEIPRGLVGVAAAKRQRHRYRSPQRSQLVTRAFGGCRRSRAWSLERSTV